MTSVPRPYRYDGKRHRMGEMARRLVEIGQAKLVAEGLDAQTALNTMRAVTSELCDEYGGTVMAVPRELAWDGLTQRDREIWAAYTGSNLPELCRQFRMCDRQMRYVIEYCRRWHAGRNQPELPGLEQPQGEPA